MESFKTFTAQVEGAADLLMHNVALANPLSAAAQAVKAVTSKRTKTEADHIELQRLEFVGSLYHDEKIGPYVPASWIEAAITASMSSVKRGQKKNVKGGLCVLEPMIPLIYDGPRDMDSLWQDARFRHVAMAKVKNARVLRCRPCFPAPWTITFSIQLMPEILNPADILDALTHAGLIEGIGDWRPRHGRFRVLSFKEVKE